MKINLKDVNELNTQLKKKVRQIKAQTLKKLKARGKLDKFKDILCD